MARADSGYRALLLLALASLAAGAVGAAALHACGINCCSQDEEPATTCCSKPAPVPRTPGHHECRCLLTSDDGRIPPFAAPRIVDVTPLVYLCSGTGSILGDLPVLRERPPQVTPPFHDVVASPPSLRGPPAP